jgi:REP element-mobilizing transposase RayT
LFLKILDRVRRRYRSVVLGYVVMPKHVHLLVSEPQQQTLSTAIQALKLGVVRTLRCASVGGGALLILIGFGRRCFMISMFGRSTSGLKNFAISIATRLSAGWCLRLSSGAGAVFDGI